MLGRWRSIADALRVSLNVLLSIVSAAFGTLVAAQYTHSRALAVLAGLGGLTILALGLRAVRAPSRPFDIGSFGAPGITTSRRLGAFYVVVGLVWVLFAVGTTRA